MTDVTFERLAAVIAAELRVPAAEVSRASTAFDLPGWDSVSHVHLMLAVEREFRVAIPFQRAVRLKNVGELADLVASLSA